MKKLVLTLILINIISNFSFADYWLQKANFASISRADATGFSISGKGYIGGGYTGVYATDFWEYDPSNNTWTQKANFPIGIVESCAFTIGSNGYVLPFPMDSSFYRYDPVGNAWSVMANFPGGARQAAVAFSIDSKGYIATGASSTLGGSADDLWEYDATTDSWLQKATLPGMARHYACGFAIGSKGYVGTGQNGSTLLDDFWEWNQQTNSWTQIAMLPGGARREACAFSIGNMGYVGMGSGWGGFYSDFYQYNPITNSWIQKASYASGREETSQFSIGPYGYAGTGWDGGSAGVMLNDFWEYHPEDSTTGINQIVAENIQLQIGPNPFTNEITISFNNQLKYKEAVIQLYDCNGKKITEHTVADKRFVLQRNGLAKGTYLVRLIIDGEIASEKKCIAL